MSEHIYENPDLIFETNYEKTIFESPDVINDMHNYVKMKPNESSAKAKTQLEQLDNVTLNIAITGESGVGKSTFVNALRGINDEDDGAAETGVTETTMNPISYSHPTMPNVYIWDLPGIGTPNFKAKKYLKDIKFDNFDFFIIIGSLRFKENDIMLAKEIKKMKKMFYFVRSKIDQDLQAEARKKGFDEEHVLSRIRLSCKENLLPIGNPKVFLISTFQLGKYDFQRLIDSLEENLSDHKWSALIQSLPVCSLGMIEKKTQELYRTAAAAATAAATTAGVPLPGFSVGCEIGIMQKYLQTAHMSFGLDDKSIERLAQRVNKPRDELKSVMKSRFAAGVNKTVVANMFRTTSMVAAKAVEVFLTGIPGFGNLPAMGIAFGTTLTLLRNSVKEMAEDAKAVITAAGL
ncbi:interferon-inducible GTPase 5-like [Lampris incognitus]|uniref:interferon-inducible GTPase 5-like n=1 Tax=Lampris incognitus TaxID=2546036 RepID=UPI0024B51C68|nr:interferon-inducible GTPase 5-like [Lampris incognitus]